jgi:beta-glucanase (GH16 family)
VSLIPVKAGWAYRYQADAPTGDWSLNRYDDASWSRGPAPIGFGSSTVSTDIDIQPTTDRPRTAYFRKAFNLTNAGAIDSVTLTTRADDGVAVYVNGIEVLRSNLMVGAEHVDYADTAVSTASAAPVKVVVPGSAFHDGYNTITAETHVNYRATNDMTFDLSAVASVPGTNGLPVVSSPDFEAPATPVGATDLPGWKLSMADEFDTFDTSRWVKYDQEAWGHEDSYVLARNATIDNGKLRLQAKPEEVGGRHWTTGEVTTRGKYSLPNYFRLEVRAKVPLEHGMWAAPIWFRPADGAAGEIDLVETYGVEQTQPYVHQTIHTDYGDAHKQTHIFTPFSRYPGAATDWHTYVIEKTPGQIVMWVDGIKSSTFNTSNTPWYDTYYEAGTRWSLRSSLQVGGSDDELPDATTDWSKTSSYLDHVYTWTME